jgi:thiol:disulfide interchange protein
VKRGFGVLILLFAVYYGLLGSRLLRTRTAPSGGGEHLVVCDNKATCFRDALNAAYAAHQPVFIDFWADWCKNCHAMDAVFADPAVKRRLAGYRVIKLDATNFKESPSGEILDHYGVLGLPTYIILQPVK